MLTSGDIVVLDLGIPSGREAGFKRPVVVITAQRLLDASPSVVQIVPLTSAIRDYDSEVTIDPTNTNGLTVRSAAQCQQIRAMSVGRLEGVVGNAGSVDLTRIRETLGLVIDVPLL